MGLKELPGIKQLAGLELYRRNFRDRRERLDQRFLEDRQNSQKLAWGVDYLEPLLRQWAGGALSTKANLETYILELPESGATSVVSQITWDAEVEPVFIYMPGLKLQAGLTGNGVCKRIRLTRDGCTDRVMIRGAGENQPLIINPQEYLWQEQVGNRLEELKSRPDLCREESRLLLIPFVT